jgi:PAS domain S-box-containing protein
VQRGATSIAPEYAADAPAERRFRAIFEASPDCIKRVSAEGRLIDMNAAGLRMVDAGCLNDLRGKSLFDLIDPAYHDSFRKGVDAVFAGQITQMQFEVVGLTGRRLFMDQSAAPLFANDDPKRVVEMMAITRDVSAQRRAEADLLQARLAQDITRSAATQAARLGQDLISPLDRIIGYSELLLESAHAEHRSREADDLKEVLHAASDLQSKLTQLLQTALAEIRQNQPPSDGGDLDDLIEAAVEAIRPLAEAKGNRINVEIGPQCTSLPADASKVAQCLQAMLSHAAKHTSNGVITAKARQMLANGQPHLVLSVVDTGAGMALKELSALLEPPASAHAHANNDSGSHSTGLAAARRLALFMGGDIMAATAPGQGSRLTLKTPLPPAAGAWALASG